MNILNNITNNQVQAQTELKSINYSKKIDLKNNDTVSFNEMSENMNLVTAYYGGGTIFEGKINGKNTVWKAIHFNNSKAEYEAEIGNKKLSMIRENNTHFVGNFGDKDFDINITKDKGKSFVKTITGTINGKTINMSFPNEEIPKDDDERDIITSILFANFNTPFILNGKIANVVSSQTMKETINNNLDRKEKDFYKYIIGPLSMLGMKCFELVWAKLTNNTTINK